MPNILHISCDYPDVVNDDKTAAVSRLVRLSDKHEHLVASLNRTSNLFSSATPIQVENVRSYKFRALPRGLGLRWFLHHAGRQLAADIGQLAFRPDIIHGHKLTFEGPIAAQLARTMNVPYCCTVRGDTDLKLIRYKPGYRRWYQSIYESAAAVFFPAPWAHRKLRQTWRGLREPPAIILPNIVNMTSRPGSASPNGRLVTICHLKDHRRKNLSRLLRAVDTCNASGLPIALDIIGGGPEESLGAVRRQVSRMRFSEQVSMLGHMDQATIAERLPAYQALVLPSLRETFGMVYLEALAAGIPILHSHDAGIDGLFDGKNVSIAADPLSVRSIADGVRELMLRNTEYRRNVLAMLDSGYMNRFSSQSIVQLYADSIDRILHPR
mgnify:CR=1 FL=1